MIRGLRRGAETAITIARDARASRFRRRLEQKFLASLPPRPLSAAERAEALRSVRRFSPRYRNLEWHETITAATGKFEAGYLPEDVFFVAIEPALNARDRELVTTDKNAYGRLGLPVHLPDVVGRIVRGRLVGADYRTITMDEAVRIAEQSGPTDVVLKATMGTGGGRDVEFVATRDLPRRLAPLFAKRSAYDDWIIQRVVHQCPELAALNPDSVNTLRIMTYRGSRGIEHVSTVMRMGRSGSRLDNQSQGGLTCGVDDGRLRRVAHQMHLPLETHPDTGLRFDGYAIPMWREAVDTCIGSHELIPAMDLISWDITIDDQYRPTLIEFNTYQQALAMHQIENGPLPPDIVSEWLARADFWVIAGLVIRKPSMY